MSTFTLNVQIDQALVDALQAAKYQLCISKKINGSYTVVWQSSSFSYSNVFQWTEEYEVSATTTFQSGIQVSTSTQAVPIALGQNTTITSTGKMDTPSGPSTGTSFIVKNNWRPTHVAITQKLNGTFKPVWVDPYEFLAPGTETLTPISAVMLFFDRDLKTSSMFVQTSTASHEVIFSGSTTQSVAYIADPSSPYGNGIWVAVGDPAAVTSIPMSYSQEVGFRPLPEAYNLPTLNKLYSLSLSSAAINGDKPEKLIGHKGKHDEE